MGPTEEMSEDREGMVPAAWAFEGTRQIPRGRKFGALVAHLDGRSVVLYGGHRKWGEWLVSKSGAKILLLDDAGSNERLRFVDEAGNRFSSWLITQRRTRRRRVVRSYDPAPSVSNRLPFRLFLGRLA